MSEKKQPLQPEPASGLSAFESSVVRRTWHEGQWWFAIVDVVAALTDSQSPEGYLKDLRRRDKGLAEGWGQIATPLRTSTPGGMQALNCANVEGVLRRDGIKGKTAANKTHLEVGRKVRQTIKELGGTLPENLPSPDKSIKQLERETQRIGKSTPGASDE